MKLSKQQLKLIIEEYLLEQEEGNSVEGEASEESDENSEAEVADTISFKVKDRDDLNVSISLKKSEKDSNHKIFIDDKLRSDIDSGLEMQILAAHGYVHPDTDKETKEVLRKILSRDDRFKGKNDSAILAVIDDKMKSSLGAQGLGVDRLQDLIEKG